MRFQQRLKKGLVKLMNSLARPFLFVRMLDDGRLAELKKETSEQQRKPLVPKKQRGPELD